MNQLCSLEEEKKQAVNPKKKPYLESSSAVRPGADQEVVATEKKLLELEFRNSPPLRGAAAKRYRFIEASFQLQYDNQQNRPSSEHPSDTLPSANSTYTISPSISPRPTSPWFPEPIQRGLAIRSTILINGTTNAITRCWTPPGVTPSGQQQQQQQLS